MFALDRSGTTGVVAEAHDVSMGQIALAWNLSKPVVTAPNIGATKRHYLDDAAATSVQLTAEQIQYLEEGYQSRPVVGFE